MFTSIRGSLPGKEVEIETVNRGDNGLKGPEYEKLLIHFQIFPIFSGNLSDTGPK